VEIIETTIYTKYISKLLTDSEYKELQDYLVKYPKSGNIIKNSGGLRKLRWKTKTKGKRGGIRNIYYYYENKNTLYMIYVYEKVKKDDLSKEELTILKSLLQEGL